MQKPDKIILAFVGMPGSGKTEATAYLKSKGFPFVRFGKVTDDGLKALGLSLTPENEQMFREKIRKDLGMAVYAIKSEPLISKLLENNNLVVIDGLYSWEEYVFLKNKFPLLIVIAVYAEPKKRYERLSKRTFRPMPLDKSYKRDIAEIEKLNKGGPIAMADYLLENNSDSIEDLYSQIDKLLERLKL